MPHNRSNRQVLTQKIATGSLSHLNILSFSAAVSHENAPLFTAYGSNYTENERPAFVQLFTIVLKNEQDTVELPLTNVSMRNARQLLKRREELRLKFLQKQNKTTKLPI